VHRHHNGLKTAVLLGLLTSLILLVGYWLGGSTGLVIAVFISLAMNAVSYFYSDKIALRSMGAQPVTDAQAPALFAMVRELSASAGQPMPRLYVSPTMQPNAFATGRNPDHAVVCVTQGLMQLLEPDEVQGVLAHEMSHVKNRDILIGSVAAAMAMAITFIARMAMFGAIFGGGGRDNEGGNVFGALLLTILAPVAAFVIQMAISRSREYEADHSGAELLGSGESLARALEKIEAYAKQVPMDVPPAQATAYIVNPLTGRKVEFGNLFTTHPPTADRVARLRHQF
jgi:heat shock protein HtpX